MVGKFESGRADLVLGALIEGLEGRFEVWRADLRQRAYLRIEAELLN